MDDTLLRSVRNEVKENVHFTPKETDIYKIHQSGDLANLDGLDDEALEKLPSLLKLRDALYSPEFREYASKVTGSGPLSGVKTDMAINVYTPGCHLLCHDDVIGSRRISYILYLPNPDIPWKAEWGGALRLYPTKQVAHTNEEGNEEVATIPSPDYSLVIPPAWNQLSFFAVQPGLSFHDVEEVYHANSPEQLAKEGNRVRMAISGWFHIPQRGEDGFIEGLEESLAAKSSLVSLQSKGDRYDFPKEAELKYPSAETSDDSDEPEPFQAEEIDFLLKFLAPQYLTPDTLDAVREQFEEQSSVSLDQILHPKFQARLRDHIEAEEAKPLPATSAEIIAQTSGKWQVARPPHKQKYLYCEPSSPSTIPQRDDFDQSKCSNPIEELVDYLLPSLEFKKWLAHATGADATTISRLARRFRRGCDYQLATEHEGEPRLELCIGMTPTEGWVPEESDDEEEGEEESDSESEDDEKPMSKKEWKAYQKQKAVEKAERQAEREKARAARIAEKAKAKAAKEAAAETEQEFDDVGGHEVYMASDNDSADAAIYRAATGDEDDGVLFSNSPAWNRMTLVLRDEGVLRFVKYVSRKARGDRWDVVAHFGVEDWAGSEGEGSGEEEEWNGIDNEE
jgi:Rps23 Pro-64 3,4-dihydroxylase Tpa1-like proline 4-hydroxylase